MSNVPTIAFHDGRRMPQLGFGVWQVDDDAAKVAVGEAFRIGYRSVDSAQAYENESGVGRAIAASGIARDSLFVTTKLHNPHQGFDSTLRAFDGSLAKLGLDYVDLYLVHWPSPHRGSYVETWKAFVQIWKEGRAKSIGVSNFQPAHLRKIIDATGVVPVLNQIELHPRFQQKDLRAFHAELGMATESWSPLGQGKLLGDKTLAEIAAKHGRTVAQIILRWHMDSGLIAIPKSVTPSRIAENFALFDFKLDGDDMARIDKLDSAEGRIFWHPDTAGF